MQLKYNRDKLVQFISNVDGEILNMCSGEGKHRPGTLHFEQGKNSCPVMNRLEILRNTPTKENMEKFLTLAVQDFGAPTGEYFRSISYGIFKVPLAEVLEAQKKAKPFDISIKDAFYDMFRTVHIAMDPKQTERMETLALQLAGVFQTEISKKVTETVKIQIGALVSTLKQQEEQRAAARQIQEEKAEDADADFDCDASEDQEDKG